MKLSLQPLYCSGLILQGEKPVRIVGNGEGEIFVEINGLKIVTKAENGVWTADLPAQPYGGPFTMTVSDGKETLTLTDVHFGDVFLMAGQSNMQFKMRDGKPPMAGYIENDHIRLFSPNRIEDTDAYHPQDGWVKCSKNDAPNFTAIGYFLAQEHYKKTGRAVGLIGCYQGASVIESWMSETALQKSGFVCAKEDLHADHFMENYSAWNKPASLYTYVFQQIVSYTFSRVIWYQGESDTTEAEGTVYDKLLAQMIACWRSDLRDETLPFVIVQIADYDDRRDAGWRAVQEAQLRVEKKLPFVKSVVSADVCESDDIHPPTKEWLAKRISDAV